MNDFLNQLDQEIDDAIPAATKKKYKPIQDDFQIINHILSILILFLEILSWKA